MLRLLYQMSNVFYSCLHCSFILACLKVHLDPQSTEVSEGLPLESEGFGSLVSVPQDKGAIL